MISDTNEQRRPCTWSDTERQQKRRPFSACYFMPLCESIVSQEEVPIREIYSILGRENIHVPQIISYSIIHLGIRRCDIFGNAPKTTQNIGNCEEFLAQVVHISVCWIEVRFIMNGT